MAFFSLFITNPLFTNSDLSELFTNKKVIRVIADLSALVHLFEILMGISLYLNASSMSSRVVLIFILFRQRVEFVKVLVDSSTVICFLVNP